MINDVSRAILLQEQQIGINEADFNPEEEIRLVEKLLYDKIHSRPLKNLILMLMSANDKFGLGYGDYRFGTILSYENEVLQSVFMNKDGDKEDSTLYVRFVTSDGMHAVPPPMTGNYMPSGPDVK
ncbi:hypothetical protein Tco_0240894 [Tanacetum coccineum]